MLQKKIIWFVFLQFIILFGETSVNQKRQFIRDVHAGFKYFRIDHDQNSTSFRNEVSNNNVFEVNLKSRRNNYEEVLMLGFSCVGKVMDRALSKTYNENNPPVVPSVLVVNCEIPLGREGTVLSVSANSALVIQFINGDMFAEQFWAEIKQSFEYSSDMGVTLNRPKILSADVDFENLVSARVAMENKNNPRVSKIISMANKASYVPGLQKRLESMLMKYMKSNHTELMTQVMGRKPSDEQMLRIGISGKKI